VKSLVSAAVITAMIALLFIGDPAADAVLSSMQLCVTRVIPTLFPYMVLSSLMLSMDLLQPLSRCLPTEKWLGLPRSSAPVLITGLLCGFPVGAAGCAALTRSGKLSREDAAILAAVSSAASPAFVIGTIGQWWGREYGTVLWLTQILCSMVFGTLIFRGSGSVPEVRSDSPNNSMSFSGHFSAAVSSAASSCIAVTAAVTFFGGTARILSRLFPLLSLPASVLLEFSQGSAAGAELSGVYGIMITGASVGFTGLSVIIQCASLLTPEKIPLRPLILSKTTAMAFSAAVSAVYYLLRCPAVQEIPAAAVFRPCDVLNSFLFPVLMYPVFRLLSNLSDSRIKHTEKL